MEKPELKKYLEFIDHYTIENRHYWTSKEIYGRYDVEIEFRRQTAGACTWQARRRETDTWTPFANYNDLIHHLATERIDFAELESQVVRSILQFAVFADQAIRNIEKLIGRSAINEAIIQNDAFLAELLHAIKGAIAPGAETSSDNLSSATDKTGSNDDALATSNNVGIRRSELTGATMDGKDAAIVVNRHPAGTELAGATRSDQATGANSASRSGPLKKSPLRLVQRRDS